jgi:hypothetical protein
MSRSEKKQGRGKAKAVEPVQNTLASRTHPNPSELPEQATKLQVVLHKMDSMMTRYTGFLSSFLIPIFRLTTVVASVILFKVHLEYINSIPIPDFPNCRIVASSPLLKARRTTLRRVMMWSLRNMNTRHQMEIYLGTTDRTTGTRS